jgi:hypothetical protein
MSPVEIVAFAVLALGLAGFGALYVRDHRRRARTLEDSPKRILFPFVGRAVSRGALDAALRLSSAERATLVPVFLARVPMHMPLDAPLLETIEQRAATLGVPVDSRIERGRSQRHALREAIAHERFDRLVVAAAQGHGEGFHSDDIAWLLDNAPGEVVVIRPSDQQIAADTAASRPWSRRRRAGSPTDRRGGRDVGARARPASVPASAR